jgi:hypothetical protein
MQNMQLYTDDSITFLEAGLWQPGTKTYVVENSDTGDKVKIANMGRFGTVMLDMLSSGKQSDPIVKCEDQELTCHKNILAARLPVFAAMVQHDMGEQRKNKVTITALSNQMVKQMLVYMTITYFSHSLCLLNMYPKIFTMYWIHFQN